MGEILILFRGFVPFINVVHSEFAVPMYVRFYVSLYAYSDYVIHLLMAHAQDASTLHHCEHSLLMHMLKYHMLECDW